MTTSSEDFKTLCKELLVPDDCANLFAQDPQGKWDSCEDPASMIELLLHVATFYVLENAKSPEQLLAEAYANPDVSQQENEACKLFRKHFPNSPVNETMTVADIQIKKAKSERQASSTWTVEDVLDFNDVSLPGYRRTTCYRSKMYAILMDPTFDQYWNNQDPSKNIITLAQIRRMIIEVFVGSINYKTVVTRYGSLQSKYDWLAYTGVMSSNTKQNLASYLECHQRESKKTPEQQAG